MENKPLNPKETLLALQKKEELLQQLLTQSQQQLALNDPVTLNQGFQSKESIVEEILRIDSVLESNAMETPPADTLKHIEQLLKQLWHTEQQLEQKLEQQKQRLSEELNALVNQGRLKNYLKPNEAHKPKRGIRRSL